VAGNHPVFTGGDMKKRPVIYKPGTRIKCPVELADNFFQRMKDPDTGNIDFDKAVYASRPKQAPLHNDLEWDNKTAGHLWRRDQVRYIVRNIQEIRPEVDIPVKKYETVPVTSLPAEDQKSISGKFAVKSLDEILADPVTRDVMLHKAITDVLAFKRKYAMLSELAVIFAAIDKVTDKIAKEA